MAETLAPIDVQAGAPPTPAPAFVRPEPGYVAVTDGGDVQLLPEENAGRAAAAGYRPATEAEFWSAKHGTTGQVVTAADAIARGATFGASDAIQVGIGRAIGGDAAAEGIRSHTRIAREANPGTAIAGEIAGALLPAAVGLGGASAAATGETALARAGSRFVNLAPRLFAEGAAMGAGQQLSEDTLGNHDLAAQKYLASALKGGLMSVVIGGGLAAGGGAIADKFGRRVAAEGGAGAAIENAAAKDANPLARAAETEGNSLSRAAERQAFMSTGAKKGDWRRLGGTAEEITGTAEQYGRRMLDEGIVTPGASQATIARRASEKLEEAGREIGAIRKTLEKSTLRPSLPTIAERFQQEVAAPLSAMPLGEREIAPAAEFLEAMVAKGGESPSFDTIWKYRRKLDDMLAGEYAKIPGSPSKAGADAMMQLRGIIKSEYEAAAERAAVDLGDDVATKLRLANAKYGELADITKIATKEAAGAAANRAISLSDNMWGMGGFVALGPKGLALAAANKVMREYGNQVAATALNRVSKVEGIAKAAQAFDTKLNTAVSAFFGKGKPIAAARTAEKVSPAATRALRDAVKNPAVMAERVADHVAATELRANAPKVTQAMTSTMMRAASWLQQKLPPEPPPRGLAFGPQPPRKLGPTDQRRVDTAVRALDADAFLTDLSNGRVDRQALEAMKFIQPELYSEVVGRMREYGMEHQPELSRQQAVALSIMTGQPLTPMMRPETIRGFQQAYAQEEIPPDPSKPGANEKKKYGGGAPPPGRAQSSRAYASAYDKMEGANGS